MCTSARQLNASVHWIPGLYMIADPLTKRLGNRRLLRGVMIKRQFAVQKEPLEALLADLPEAPPDGCETLFLVSR